jgi:hypothetical protein
VSVQGVEQPELTSRARQAHKALDGSSTQEKMMEQLEQVQTQRGVESQHALDMAQEMERNGVDPVAKYVAVAGHGWGWVKVWAIEDGYLVYWGNDWTSYAALEETVDFDELAAWIEWNRCYDIDAIERRANIRGAVAIPEAAEDAAGPFYVLMTRYGLGSTEESDLLMDNMGLAPVEFKTYKEAQKEAQAWIAFVSRLEHNEIGRLSYKVVTRCAASPTVQGGEG